MNIPIGWIIALGCALGGYALHGGNIMVLWQPTEVLTIVGAAIGTMIASNCMTNLKKMRLIEERADGGVSEITGMVMP